MTVDASTAFTKYFISLFYFRGYHDWWIQSTVPGSSDPYVKLQLLPDKQHKGTIYEWVLYHRLHHKHFGTNQDPFNPSKGFFHAHFLCLLQKEPPEQEELKKTIDMSDLENDGVVMFQKKYYWILYLSIFMLLPIYIPLKYWKESLLCAGFIAGLMRYGFILHFVWLIHSGSLIFGLKKGEKFPSDTNIVFLWYKTYWLQYHYLTPWDYQSSEYGKYGTDFITAFIRICAAVELATDLRTGDCAVIQNALYMSMETKKPISECLLEIESNGNVPKDHYLNPKKYY